jgi:hypothetical protein
LLCGDRHKFDGQSLKQDVQLTLARIAMACLRNDAAFNERCHRHSTVRVSLDCPLANETGPVIDGARSESPPDS